MARGLRKQSVSSRKRFTASPLTIRHLLSLNIR